MYRSIFYAMILYGAESLWLSPTQVARLDRFHFLNMRSILGVTAPYISRVSHAQVHSMANDYGLKAGSLAQVYVSRRLKLLGHILRHRDSLESNVMFDHAGNIRALDYSRTGVRVGHPRPHWPEMAIHEAHLRSGYETFPPLADYTSPFYEVPDMTQVWQAYGGSIYSFNAHFGHVTRDLQDLANNRARWVRLAGR